MRWYRLSTDQGNATAQYNLGLMYAIGEGVLKDEAEAVKWYRMAAEQGLAMAQVQPREHVCQRARASSKTKPKP